MRLITLIVTTATLFPLCHAQKFRFTAVSESVIEQREQNPPASNQERAARMRQLFAEAGCTGDRLSEQPLATTGSANVVCRLQGKNKEAIIVGANYNQSSPDNWTAASLLPSLFQSLAGRKRRHTYLFVAFSDSSDDLAGAEFFVRQMTPDDVEHTEGRSGILAHQDLLERLRQKPGGVFCHRDVCVATNGQPGGSGRGRAR
jgi:hypothetical protein